MYIIIILYYRFNLSIVHSVIESIARELIVH